MNRDGMISDGTYHFSNSYFVASSEVWTEKGWMATCLGCVWFNSCCKFHVMLNWCRSDNGWVFVSCDCDGPTSRRTLGWAETGIGFDSGTDAVFPYKIGPLLSLSCSVNLSTRTSDVAVPLALNLEESFSPSSIFTVTKPSFGFLVRALELP